MCKNPEKLMDGFPCVVLSEPYVIDNFDKPGIASKDIKVRIGGNQIKVLVHPVLGFHVPLEPVHRFFPVTKNCIPPGNKKRMSGHAGNRNRVINIYINQPAEETPDTRLVKCIFYLIS